MSKNENLSDLIIENKENAEELSAANKNSALNNDETEKNKSKLILANKQNAKELSVAYKIIASQEKEIKKQATVLIRADKEKEKHRADLLSAKKELVLATEKAKHAVELTLLNKDLTIQITERLSIEKAFLKNERELKRAQEITHIGSWYLDIGTNQVTWSEELYKMYGFDSKQPVPPYTEHMNLFTSESWEKLSTSLAKTIETGIPYELELKTIKKGGYNGWMWVRGEAIKDIDGKTIALWGAAQDITERKLFEKELVKAKEKAEKSEKLFRSTLDNLLEGCQILGFDWRFLYLNVSAAKQGRKPKEEFIGRTIMEVLPGIEDTELFAGIKLVMEERITLFMLNEFKYYDGAKGWFELYLQPVEEGVFILSIDVTERKRAELQLQEKNEELEIAKEKAEESDRLKSAFLANMSHEIRTPMNGILGFAGLLKEAELSGKQQQEYIRIIEKSGARMLNIINDIVSISKIESGTMEVYISDVNINGQTQYVYDILKQDAEQKKLNLVLKNGLPDKESILKTDYEKFISILSNLVKNAIKYTDQGSIEFGYDLSETHGDVSLQFYIKDTGIGIPKDRQEAIFERFIQADIVDKMARQGAGLGLSISRAYVEMLGGKIWVESEEGIGSTFYFSIPYNNITKEKLVKSNLSPDREDKIQLKILIVEDDETSEALLKAMLHKLNKEVLTAKNGVEAVNLCRQNPDLDLILMDIQMSELNGYKATQQIRQFNKEVIIIAQTAFGLSGDRVKSIAAGCNDYFSKPIKKDDLLALIQKYFKE